jgi:hypothetical protein
VSSVARFIYVVQIWDVVMPVEIELTLKMDGSRHIRIEETHGAQVHLLQAFQVPELVFQRLLARLSGTPR